MTSKTIQLYRKENGNLVKSYRVRFYSSGIYTIIGTDNAEHEAGEWTRKRYILDNGLESRDKKACFYKGGAFGNRQYTATTLKELAVRLGNQYRLDHIRHEN